MRKTLAEYGPEALAAWHDFVERARLTQAQAAQFEQYACALLTWNETMNLTAITEIPALLRDHFQDSLALSQFISLEHEYVCDVGSGGGFPGIPLKIMHPDVPMVLLEVNTKKIKFLTTMVQELALHECEVCTLDWRTFIHKGPYPITLFIARASLKPEELLRVFARGSSYAHATVVYWASALWQPTADEARFIVREEAYEVGEKKRRLIFFRKK